MNQFNEPIITVCTSDQVVVKQASLVDGKLSTKLEDGMPVRRMERRRLNIDRWQDDYLDIVDGITTKQFIMHGTFSGDDDIVPCYPAEEARRNNLPGRGNDLTFPSRKHGTFVVDYDGSDLTIEQIHSIMATVFDGAFEGAGYVGMASSSSYLYDEQGNELKGRGGSHVVYMMDEQAAFFNMKDVIHARLCLAGHYTRFINKAGGFSLRTIVDTKMFEIHQPEFVSGVECRDGVVQRRPDPEIVDGDIVRVSAIPPLTPDERRAYDALFKQERGMVSVEIRERKAAHAKEMAGRFADRVKSSRAESAYKLAMERQWLTADCVIETASEQFTIAEVLDDPERFQAMGWVFRDPLEPDYGEDKAKVFVENDIVTIHSFAHGGVHYRVGYGNDDLLRLIKKRVKKGADPVEAYEDLAARGLMTAGNAVKLFSKLKELFKASVTRLHEIRKAYEPKGGGDGYPMPTEEIAEECMQALFYSGGGLMVVSDQFWWFNGQYWERTADKKIEGAIQDYVLSMGLQNPINETVSAVTQFIKRDLSRFGDHVGLLTDYDPAPVINLQNGEYWLDSKRLKGHAASSKQAGIANYRFDRAATCPTFDAMLELMFPDDPDTQRSLLTVLCYAIQPLRNRKKIVYVHGNGFNAKSPLFFNLLRLLIGDDLVTPINMDKLADDKQRFALARLVRKRIAVEDDMVVGCVWPESLIKKASQSTDMVGENKGKDDFVFRNGAVIFVLANGFPTLRDVSLAVTGRIFCFNTPMTFKESEAIEGDPYTTANATAMWTKIFNDELPGVLNRILGYYDDAVDAGKPLFESEACKQAKAVMIRKSNAVSSFVDEKCVIGKEYSILRTELRLAYELWAEVNLGGQYVKTPRGFNSAIEQMGFATFADGQGYDCFKGITLKTKTVRAVG